MSLLKTKANPDGAVRLELFVDLVPPDEEVPAHPGAIHGGRPWYLRSYTRSPIVIAPPMARVPMRIVYWARWADSTGNVGPFSATAVAWIEGGNVSRPAMRVRGPETKLIEHESEASHRESTYTVALIEAHYLSFNANEVSTGAQNREQPKLEATVMTEVKQIEGRVEEAA